MFLFRWGFLGIFLPLLMVGCGAASTPPPNPNELDQLLNLPEVGSKQLRVLAPDLIELELITTKGPAGAPFSDWDFVEGNSPGRLPPAAAFDVQAGTKKIPVAEVGFKRRARYAPLKKRDLRIDNFLYLRLAQPILEEATVRVASASGALGKAGSFEGRAEKFRFNPALHINETGYELAGPKAAMVGFYLGSLGEMKLPAPGEFALVEAATHREVFHGPLVVRKDIGFTFPCYQNVWEADFSSFKTPGEYRLFVAGLGCSLPFWIQEGIAGTLARNYALGLYHQRCGAANELPFTRFVHDACHTAPAEVPDQTFQGTQAFLKEMASDAKSDPRHTAAALQAVNASLYPFVRKGKIDVAGGHHDAGDYSKYTINSAALIHLLVFAADAFPGAGDLDNLGIPESGDGKSDLLEEAKWEADFLKKLQDDDGGFYFLVYPKERQYEHDVLPDHGDPQVVFPKTTSATAAAVAALAQAGSSPLFRKQFPEAANEYLEHAKAGWKFLERALAKNGWNGAYQKITHYGNEFGHDDELVWAATELFLATGDPALHDFIKKHFDPESRDTKRWTWVRLFEAYGCAIRSYAFGARTGRIRADQLDRAFLAKCETETVALGDDQARFAKECAYGTSFPDPTKRFRTAGWYFSGDAAFDMAVAYQITPKPDYLQAIWTNFNYEQGCNPVNVDYLTGLGWKRQFDIVHQYAQNDRRRLPPSGLPLGNVQAGFMFLDNYQKELGTLTFPSDGAEDAPYPFYDRWGDSFNTSTEFVISNQGKGLGAAVFLMAQTPVKNQPWRAKAGKLTGLTAEPAAGKKLELRLEASGLDTAAARILWEGGDLVPTWGERVEWTPSTGGPNWIEVEAVWPDGRRVFGAQEVRVR